MRSYRILVVDDDSGILEMLVQWLQGENHWPTAAVKMADQALALLDRQSFDVVLTNNMMPGMLGIEMAAVIRDRDGPPVIIMTGYHRAGIRREAFASGVRAFMYKPFKLERVLEVIAGVVDRGLHYIG